MLLLGRSLVHSLSVQIEGRTTSASSAGAVRRRSSATIETLAGIPISTSKPSSTCLTSWSPERSSRQPSASTGSASLEELERLHRVPSWSWPAARLSGTSAWG